MVINKGEEKFSRVREIMSIRGGSGNEIVLIHRRVKDRLTNREIFEESPEGRKG